MFTPAVMDDGSLVPPALTDDAAVSSSTLRASPRLWSPEDAPFEPPPALAAKSSRRKAAAAPASSAETRDRYSPTIKELPVEERPRERLLAPFDINSPLCPFIAASVEIQDPKHPARTLARDYKKAIAARFTETAREAGATDPEQLGEQLALLLDGASARNRVLNTKTFATAAATAAILIDSAIPTAA